MYAALLVGGKEILAALPNVEIVTLLTAVCAYVWGGMAFASVNVFIAADMAIWGVNTWILTYLVHWNAVALCFFLLGRARFRHRRVEVLCVTAAAIVLTVLFGVTSTIVDTSIGYTGKGFFTDFEQFFPRFAALYTAGAPFFITQTVCNAVLFPTAFVPLCRLNVRAKTRLQPPSEEGQSD